MWCICAAGDDSLANCWVPRAIRKPVKERKSLYDAAPPSPFRWLATSRDKLEFYWKSNKMTREIWKTAIQFASSFRRKGKHNRSCLHATDSFELSLFLSKVFFRKEGFHEKRNREFFVETFSSPFFSTFFFSCYDWRRISTTFFIPTNGLPKRFFLRKPTRRETMLKRHIAKAASRGLPFRRSKEDFRQL